MDRTARPDRRAEEIARIREVVARHDFPGFVLGFDVELGEFDGDPAMWILFKTRPRTEDDTQRLEDRAAQLGRLRHDVQRALLAEFEVRFPYFRFRSAEPSKSHTH